jgi:hypothetical protein
MVSNYVFELKVCKEVIKKSFRALCSLNAGFLRGIIRVLLFNEWKSFVKDKFIRQFVQYNISYSIILSKSYWYLYQVYGDSSKYINTRRKKCIFIDYYRCAVYAYQYWGTKICTRKSVLCLSTAFLSFLE